jgi:uncharacterized protein (DUF1499 family)
MKQKRDRKVKVGKVMMYFGIGVVALIVIMIGQMVVSNLRTPGNLGVKDGKLAPMPSSPNAASSQSDEAYYKVEPLPLKADLAKTKAALLAAVESYGGGKVIEETETYIYVVFTTPTMKYKDDLEFYISESEGLVHYRSSSRIGYSDMGLNRTRYNEIAKLYSEIQE